MDKTIDLLNSTPIKFPLSPGDTSSSLSKTFNIAKKTKIFQTLEEAFAAFDNEEEALETEYLIPEVQLPPIPQKEDVINQLMQNALLLIDGGEYALSRNLLSEVLKKDPQCEDGLRWMGWCFKQEGVLNKAQDFYQQLTQLRQVDQDFFELGEIYYQQNKDEEAIACWHRSLEICGSESAHLFDLYRSLGNAFTRTGDFESAEENYNKAHTLRNNSDALQVNFGTLALQRQNYLQGMAYFKTALEINPFNDKAWCGISLVAKEMRDPEWAKATVLKALDINPTNEVAKGIFEVLNSGT